jgi:predicted site-specific integrase-resolvase
MTIAILPKRMRANQVALENSVHVNTVWNYARKGKLTPIKVSKGVTVFDRNEVDRLFGSNQPEGQ